MERFTLGVKTYENDFLIIFGNRFFSSTATATAIPTTPAAFAYYSYIKSFRLITLLQTGITSTIMIVVTFT